VREGKTLMLEKLRRGGSHGRLKKTSGEQVEISVQGRRHTLRLSMALITLVSAGL